MPQAPDQIVDVLGAACVKRVYGGKIERVHVRQQEAGASATGAEAHLAGELMVCGGSCRPGIDLARTNLRH